MDASNHLPSGRRACVAGCCWLSARVPSHSDSYAVSFWHRCLCCAHHVYGCPSYSESEIEMSFDLEIAEKEFLRRYQEYNGKQIDNSSLVAGSPMYCYCDGCCIQVAVLPESWFLAGPPDHCKACEKLAELGVIDRLITEAGKSNENSS